MKTLDTIAGKMYVVMSPNGGTVTSADGLISETVEAGKQKIIIGTGAQLQLDDAAGKIVATFKCAPAKLMALGLLGGGSSTSALPSGYIAAEFLESTGTQYIQTALMQGNADVYTLNMDNTTRQNYLFGARAAWNSKNIGLSYEPANKRWVVGWGNANNYSTNYSEAKNLQIEYKKGYFTVNGVTKTFAVGTGVPVQPLALFAVNQAGSPLLSNGVLIRSFQVLSEGAARLDFIPALAPHGEPCMYDKVSKQPLYNSGTGSFIVGFTLAQAKQLSKLPATGGTLTISLPSNYAEDEGVVNALATAESNGWVFTYQTYEAEASTASTFALRRIFVRKMQNENGQYVDADGTRWYVEWCAGMIGAEPTDHGYEPFRSVDAAVAYWELTPWVDPEAEKMMQEELLTNSTTND